MITERYKPLVFTAAAATGAAAAAALYGPGEAVRIIGTMVLTGVGYGVANDLLACRDCIEYFTVGHIWDGREFRHRLVQSLNPNLNALVWGAVATWHVSALAGVMFATLARMPLFGTCCKITARQLAPWLAVGAGVAFVVAHVVSKRAYDDLAAKGRCYYSRVPKELQPSWHRCNVRNSAGYASIALGGLVLDVVILAARYGLIRM